jgi:ABC-type multidrug transport system fused ATPase/permease subunit
MVQEALDEVMRHRTVLIISHRLSTIRNADCIFVLDPNTGKIAESGHHDELIQKKGIYYSLYKLQSLH